jgi:putative membrane protein
MRIKTIALAMSFAFALPAAADGQKKDAPAAKATTISDGDLKTIAHVQHVNKLEVELGKLAQKTGTTAEVKKFGAMMVTDHSKAEKELAAFAKQRNIAAIPTDDPDPAKVDAVAKLKTLKGAEFDREYLRMMAESHDEELAKSDPTITATSDADLKKMLEKRKMTLQKHAEHAKHAHTALVTPKTDAMRP